MIAGLARRHGLEVVSVDALTACVHDRDVAGASVELDARTVVGLPVYAAVADVLSSWDEELRACGALAGPQAASQAQGLLDRFGRGGPAGWSADLDPAAGIAGVHARAKECDERTGEDAGPYSAVDCLAGAVWQEANERMRTGTFGQVPSYGPEVELLATLLTDRYGSFVVFVPRAPARTLAPHLIAEYALRHLDLLPVARAEARLAARTVPRPAAGRGRGVT
jgi:hypothetical protein